YVTAAQIVVQSYGVRVLSFLGPTESMIIADESADPDRLALDLLNEAEHGGDSAALLVTPSAAQAEEVRERLPRYLDRLPARRREFAEAALSRYGGAIVVDAVAAAAAPPGIRTPRSG
ncbi:MAG: histidinol dehydrogenase, partial [Bacillati bacterium ANGP1]